MIGYIIACSLFAFVLIGMIIQVKSWIDQADEIDENIQEYHKTKTDENK